MSRLRLKESTASQGMEGEGSCMLLYSPEQSYLKMTIIHTLLADQACQAPDKALLILLVPTSSTRTS